MDISKRIESPDRPHKIKIGLAQTAPVLGDVQRNLDRHLEIIKRARSRSIDLLVFPELSLTGYFLKDMVSEISLPLEDKRIAALAEAGAGLDLVAGLVEESPDHRFYNSAVYFSDGSLTAVHRKVYLPTYGMFDEQRYFSAGDCVAAFGTPLGRCGMLICEDMWHSSLPYIIALDGALILISISSSPAHGIDQHPQSENTRSVER
ncbi:nitrilase-related carbon-nitrogen hydrolase, partial [candidate division KSB1 bacterium]